MRIRTLPRVLPRALPPLADTIFFEGFMGRYADSPRAIAEELARRGDPRRRVWSLEERTADVPPDVTVVKTWSTGHANAVQRAGWLVSGITMMPELRKRPGTRYLQTWHGTPLKRIGEDIETPRSPSMRRYLANSRNDAQRWDCLLSPSAYATKIFRSAFCYDGPIFESGYPRNDMLLAPGADALRASVRSQLGLEDRVAVLYAPTFRDDQSDTGDHAVGPRLDVSRLARQLGPDHAVMVRLHPLEAAAWQEQLDGVSDVSAWPDIRDLYLAADILVTDYSSVMFDFAVTGKPMAFFVDDLDAYQSQIRGLYFDLFADPPGPVAKTTDELTGQLDDLEALRREWQAPYDRFREQFCPFEDGQASTRVVDAFFS